mmetsp:Transcript_47120/g.151197  ORF Transcript_47120/g.151197 Transcript_47120/m.151197 type:complete len:221 (+) Transcript_47120:712-1374(+)
MHALRLARPTSRLLRARWISLGEAGAAAPADAATPRRLWSGGRGAAVLAGEPEGSGLGLLGLAPRQRRGFAAASTAAFFEAAERVHGVGAGPQSEAPVKPGAAGWQRVVRGRTLSAWQPRVVACRRTHSRAAGAHAAAEFAVGGPAGAAPAPAAAGRLEPPAARPRQRGADAAAPAAGGDAGGPRRRRARRRRGRREGRRARPHVYVQVARLGLLHGAER